MTPCLVLMLKYPRPGAVKTRLIPVLGAERACAVYRTLVQYTVRQAREFAAKTGASLVARVADAPDEEAVREWLGTGIRFEPQGEGDLGHRMEHAVRNAFCGGASSVLVIGADCPGLTAEHLQVALELLESKDLVVGPAADGGYYLIGLRRFLPELFRGIPWSTSRVLETTLKVAERFHLSLATLETLHDLDCPEDLPLWAQSVAARMAGQGRISIVIPAWNAAAELKPVLQAAAREQPHEIIVVDGGSEDETVHVARALDAIVLSAPRGRAVQMNRGAAMATGEFLLFLHADTLLPAGYTTQVVTALSQPNVVAGAFTFALDTAFPGRRLIETTARWRARFWQMPYGDQGLFLRRELFQHLGGFPEMPILEDYELVRRLRRMGRIAIVPLPAVTSARRWQQVGVVRTTLINKLILLAYHSGVSPARLAAWYRRGRFWAGRIPVSESAQGGTGEVRVTDAPENQRFGPVAGTPGPACVAPQRERANPPETKSWE